MRMTSGRVASVLGLADHHLAPIPFLLENLAPMIQVENLLTFSQVLDILGLLLQQNPAEFLPASLLLLLHFSVSTDNFGSEYRRARSLLNKSAGDCNTCSPSWSWPSSAASAPPREAVGSLNVADMPNSVLPDAWRGASMAGLRRTPERPCVGELLFESVRSLQEALLVLRRLRGLGRSGSQGVDAAAPAMLSGDKPPSPKRRLARSPISVGRRANPKASLPPGVPRLSPPAPAGGNLGVLDPDGNDLNPGDAGD
eukprot:CAMPEP_0180542122 /NCGR_PEP_ID=MMETSP1036_2-20121128/68300_1 /TAXON_ID=632150 /ORGANISM="Azadinium spinosum, Strain 3D9" /LENGTH=254 /DNA_ID=CAMNT_0022557001 /DNA_START=95 /DNA_END=858 /DNA_ORIENTATION=-